jgi:tryptophan-rich sensory protein
MLSYPVIAALAWAIFLGLGGGLLTSIGPWYRNLRKPSWQPPDWLFGPAWTIILGLAAWAGVIVWNITGSYDTRYMILAVYGANLVGHFLWSPLFFTLRRPDWALIEVVFLWLSVAAMFALNISISQIAGLMILPYLLWVSFAAALNAKIVSLNRPFGKDAE